MQRVTSATLRNDGITSLSNSSMTNASQRMQYAMSARRSLGRAMTANFDCRTTASSSLVLIQTYLYKTKLTL